ncbi:hypothetical protein Tco_0408793 [Tanacetum coccineum]
MEITVVKLVEEQMSSWKEAYNDDKLNTFKPHHISVTSFKTPYENEVPLTTHMCKVANISPEPFKSLLPPFGDVNTDDITDRESYPSPQVAAIQPAEEPATTADITQSIDASESAEELGNQRKPADAEKGMILLVNKNDDITTGSRIKLMGDALFDEFGGADANLDANESPFDTKSEIKFIGKEVPKFIYIGSQVNEGDTQGTGLSIFDQEELSKADEAAIDNVIDELDDMAKVNNLESSLAQRVADKIKDSVPILVADAFEESVPELLFETIKNILPQIIKDSIKQALTKFDKRVKKTLNAEIPELLIKPLNNAFNLLNKKEDNQLDKNDVNLRELFDLIRDLVILIDSTSALSKVAPEGD